MKYKYVVSAFFIAIICAIGLPCDIELVEKEKKYNDMMLETTSKVDKSIKDEDIIITNANLLAWTVLGYYYPDNSVEYFEDGKEYLKVDSKHTYWLMLQESISQEYSSYLTDKGYTCILSINDGMLGANRIHIYKYSK